MDAATKALKLIETYGKELAIKVCEEMLYELKDLLRIPYNQRRTFYWEDVHKILIP